MKKQNLKRLFSILFLIASYAQAQEIDSVTIKRFKLIDSTKSGYKAQIKIGNPTNKDIEMVLDDYAEKKYPYDLVITPHWFDFKKRLNENQGLQLSINYSSIFLGSTNKVNPDSPSTTASGIFDATVKWSFLNRKKGKDIGALVFWVDNRHLYYGDVPPQFFFQEAGTTALSATKFNQWDFHMLEFYYQQALFGDRMAVVIGKIDMPDWFNFNALAHPNLHFTDLSFLFNPTISVSNPGLGIIAGGWLDKDRTIGIIAGLNDVAGNDVTSTGFFEFGATQWPNGNFLKMVEILWTPKRSQYYAKRISATFWHSDELQQRDNSFFTSPSSKGFTVQASWTIKDVYTPVFTFGLSDGMGANALSDLNISLMNAWNFRDSYDMLGVGINYSRSTITGRSQFMSEIFYRWTFSKTTQFSPLVKFAINPALDPTTNFMMYYGIRSRISI